MKLVTKKKWFRRNYITLLREQSKMLLSMTIIWLSKNLIISTSCHRKFRMKSLKVCLKALKVNSRISLKDKILDFVTKWLWICIAESLSQEKLSWNLVKSLKKCSLSIEAQRYFMSHKVSCHSYNYHVSPFLETTN